jgi:dTDP-4-amino-4,6-dideoxygalactose transaminase
MKHLLYENIQTGIHYPVPVHLQPAYNTRIRTSTSMSVTEMLANEVLSLPIYPELSLSSVRHVVAAIRKYFNENQNS